MRDIKTYLSVAPVLSTLWFGALAGLLIEINRLFPDALSFPLIEFLFSKMGFAEFFMTLRFNPIHLFFLFPSYTKKKGLKKGKFASCHEEFLA